MKICTNGYCLICFKRLNKESSLSSLFSTNNIICNECLSKFKVLNSHLKILGVDTWFLYEYDSFFKQLLYRYKGCYDIALKDTFLYMFKDKIRLLYSNYIIVYPPSSEKDDLKRGFIHIERICDCLHMKTKQLFSKKFHYKQSDQHFSDRHLIDKVITLKDKVDKTKKYLIIDDIYTSGSTIKTIIKLLISKGVLKENIKVIVLAKTII